MKKKREDERENEEIEMKRNERKDVFSPKNVSRPSNPPDELAQNVSKKIPFGRIILHSFESSESDRIFNYLHDSNSIFRAPGINSEWVFGRTVRCQRWERPEPPTF